ncbi:MAG: M1 family peptidase, partial [Actinomycetes bacterium]
MVGTRPATAAGVLVAVTTLGVLTATGASAAPGQPGQPRFSAGSSGVGDPYFPYSGNGGYDVQHYHLDLDYTPPSPASGPLQGQLEGRATIDLVATQDLDRFNLDLRGLTVSSVSIDGKPATSVPPPATGQIEGAAYWHVQDGTARAWELTVQPRPKLKAGERATIEIAYGGATGRPADIEGAPYGWWTTRDGAMVVNEPDGAMTWFPVSDHPTDKASYSFEITVPEGKAAIANGLPSREPTTEGG